MTERSVAVVEADDDVEISQVRWSSPLSARFPRHPEGCDHLSYLRYRSPQGPADPADADTILIMQPGSWGGAYSLDRIARNVVTAAAAGGAHVEWWSIARRSYGATDVTGIEAATRAGDPMLALEYYYLRRRIDGRRFAGFQRDRQLAYLADLGLPRTIRDQYELIQREVPARRRAKVLLGGHSLGAVINGVFGAWDFDGTAGHELCDGFVSIDSLLDADPLGVAERPLLRRALGSATGPVYPVTRQLARRALMPRTYSFLQISRPEVFTAVQLAGLASHLAGDEETDLLRRLPPSAPVDRLLRAQTARAAGDVLRGRGLREFRLTGDALLGLLTGTGYGIVDALTASMGRPVGPVAQRGTFLGPWLGRIPGASRPIASLVNPNTWVPTDRHTLYRWDRSADIADIRDFARQLVAGPLGYLDHYMPMRLQFEAMLLAVGCRTGAFAAVKHERAAAAKPLLNLLAGNDHIVPILLDQFRLRPQQHVAAPGYTHIDMVTAAPGPDEPVSQAIAGFASAMQQDRQPVGH